MKLCSESPNLAAGFKSGRHSHPGLVLAYVAEGEFWYHIDGQTEKIYKVGNPSNCLIARYTTKERRGTKPSR